MSYEENNFDIKVLEGNKGVNAEPYRVLPQKHNLGTNEGKRLRLYYRGVRNR